MRRSFLHTERKSLDQEKSILWEPSPQQWDSEEAHSCLPAAGMWRSTSSQTLTPSMQFSIHQLQQKTQVEATPESETNQAAACCALQLMAHCAQAPSQSPDRRTDLSQPLTDHPSSPRAPSA